MAWTFNAAHGLSSTPTAVVVVDTSDTSFDANGTPKDLIGTATVDPAVTVTTAGAWGAGFVPSNDGGVNPLGISWGTDPAFGLGAVTNGCTIVFFVNGYDGTNLNGFVAQIAPTGSDSIRLNAGAPSFYISSGFRFTATTPWPTDGTAFAHALAYHGNTEAKALYGLQSASDLSADGSAVAPNVGNEHTLAIIGGFPGGGYVLADYHMVLVFDEIVSDADLQAIFDDPMIFVDQGAASVGPGYYYAQQ